MEMFQVHQLVDCMGQTVAPRGFIVNGTADNLTISYPATTSLKVPWFIKNMVTVTANTLTTEQRGEALTFRNHLLWDANILFGFRLTDDKFTNL